MMVDKRCAIIMVICARCAVILCIVCEISSSVKEISSQLDINILSNTNVEFIDHKNNTLITSKKNISYDKLVLAIGANQIRVPIEGSSKDLPLTVNNLEEYIKFRNAITGKKM